MKQIYVRFKPTLANLLMPAKRSVTLTNAGYTVGHSFVTLYCEGYELSYPVNSIERISVVY